MKITFWALLALLPALSASPARCQPPPWVVDPTGNGDSRTIAEAMAAIGEAQLTDPRPRQLILMPGRYDEVLDLAAALLSDVGCPGGAESTEVSRVLFPPSREYWGGVVIRGLAIRDQVASPRGDRDASWFDCTFRSGITSGTVVGSHTPNFKRCGFEGRTAFLGYVNSYDNYSIDSCAFVRAPVLLNNDPAGDIGMRGCTFEGPVDTALTVQLSSSNYFHLTDCTFRFVEYGVVLVPYNLVNSGLLVIGCEFASVANTAIAHDGLGPWAQPDTRVLLNVADTRFEDCGKAIFWNPRFDSRCDLARDTVLRCGGPAIELVTSGAWHFPEHHLEQLLVEDCLGDGVLVRIEAPTMGFDNSLGAGWLKQSAFRRNAGHGFVLARFEVPTSCFMVSRPFVIENCEFTDNGGHGCHVSSQALRVRRNLFWGNGGSGFRLDQASPELLRCRPNFGFPLDSIVWNTFAGNRANGLAISAYAGGDSAIIVANNAVAANGGAGIFYSGGPAAEFHGNGGWRNQQGSFVGLPPSARNFEADPGFCDPLAADFHVQEGSQYATTGPWGEVGAFGVGCDASRIEVSTVQGDERCHDRGNGLVRFALLGNPFFDASRVLPSSVRVGTAMASSFPHPFDVNRDGWLDFVAGVHRRELGAGGVAAVTLDGIRMRGTQPSCDHSLLASPEEVLQPFDEMSASIWPMPSRALAGLRLSLPRPGTVTLEIHDVAGRRVALHSLPDLSPGEQVLPLQLPTGQRPGLYMVTLVQGSTRISVRWVVTE